MITGPAVESLEGTGHQLLEQARARVRPSLRDRVEGRLTENRAAAGYHLGWLDEHGDPSEAGAGKAVRPALCYAAAEAVEGDIKEAGSAAMTVQLVHDFSLAHDDIIDGDRVRRNRPAVWAAFGTPAGVLCGDALLSLAFITLAEAGGGGRALARLAEAVGELIEGEALDMAFEQREQVRLGEYTAMAAAKTGALMGCACALGALSAGCDENRADLLAAFGRHVGVAFQITDDVLGICGRQEVTGKPVGADLASGKKTLPILAALASGTPAGRELAELYAGPGELADEHVDRATHLVTEAGGVTAARQEIERELQQALAALAESGPAPRGRQQLTALAHVLTHRDQ
ncbi:polyprenyl synthetase family protein [Streptomyces iconiensis]|uniref:Polyprenyl synthetase family protein n=1 Tax=Streptomyces iconiensis TaxID=1384038 RepID=A0ABT7A1E4_9ACTN|nr:polyprenyl synthetase family protein [Streptomyces iconiensis]MDJ1135153.1 polyprenyl synthetase family protein [Streptomyces iconiensis]